MSLYHKYRPQKLSQVVGQDAAVKQLSGMLKADDFPRAVLFTGGSGVGKTTIARIVADKLGCDGSDLKEINCAAEGGIDIVRKLAESVQTYPMFGECRVFILDEAHKLSQKSGKASDAQSALLKILEDVPEHAYFFLCTTDPQQLLRTIVTRCTVLKLKDIHLNSLRDLVADVADKEGKKLSDDVIDKISEEARGSAREALSILERVIVLDDEKSQLEAAYGSVELMDTAKKLMAALVFEKPNFTKALGLVKGVPEDEHERFRHYVLTVAKNAMLGGGKGGQEAYIVADCFARNWNDCREAGLVLAIYEVFGKNK